MRFSRVLQQHEKIEDTGKEGLRLCFPCEVSFFPETLARVFVTAFFLWYFQVNALSSLQTTTNKRLLEVRKCFSSYILVVRVCVSIIAVVCAPTLSALSLLSQSEIVISSVASPDKFLT